MGRTKDLEEKMEELVRILASDLPLLGFQNP